MYELPPTLTYLNIADLSWLNDQTLTSVLRPLHHLTELHLTNRDPEKQSLNVTSQAIYDTCITYTPKLTTLKRSTLRWNVTQVSQAHPSKGK